MSQDDFDQSSMPLCVDLDGTLIKTDSLHELFLQLLKRKPLYCFVAIFWLLKSKAHFKAKISEHVSLLVESLPYNQEITDYIQSQKAHRNVFLVTGCNQQVAKAIAKHLDLFDEVIASDSETNLTGNNKRQYLVDRFGEKGFEYIGNDTADMSVWSSAGKVSVASKENGFLKKVRKNFSVEKEFILPSPSIKNYLKAIRLHQWVKNLLVFVPLFLDHRFHDYNAVFQLVFSFFSLSLLASFTYIINDLLDLESDRLNSYKSKRPFASCVISIKQAIVMMFVLLLSLIILFSMLSMPVIIALMIYLLTTLSYSFFLKSVAILDVTILAGLFSLRVICGVVAIDAAWSFWLLAFSMFFFLSLAFAKRFSEVDNLRREGRTSTVGRGYTVEDLPMLSSFGIASGYISILVVALYINSEKVRQMYTNPEFLWLICPLLLYWIGRIWMITGRGKMHEDPIVFAIRDKVSMITALLCLIILVAGSLFSGHLT